MSIRKWKVIAPLAVTAVGALAAGVATLTKKTQTQTPTPAAKAPVAPPAPGMLKTGTYSFISGYKDAVTVELTLQYAAEIFSFDVISEDFLSYSSASHVAVLCGEDFNIQIEYAPYYAGEDFETFAKGIEQKFRGYGPARYASLSGIRYRDGDSMCLCFPIPGDAHSFIQIILFKLKDDDEPLDALPEAPAVKALLDTVKLEVKR